jgi:hypothetical protein
VIIEVKLFANAESRRAVVPQVLSYAGYLQGLDPEQLAAQVLGAKLAPHQSVLAAVQADDQEQAIDPESSARAWPPAWPRAASGSSSFWTLPPRS